MDAAASARWHTKWSGSATARVLRAFARAALALAVVAAVLGAPPVAAATVLTVDRTDDDPAASACLEGVADDCSLRGAIINANADALAEVEEIHLPAGTYTLTTDGDTVESGSLNIQYSAEIIGAGSASTIIDGNDIDKVLAVIRGAGPPSERAVDLSGLTIRNGDACAGSGGDTNGIGHGGGLLLHGIVTLTDVIVEDSNTCASGGGIFAAGGTQLTMSGGAIRGNTSSGSGGGLLSEGATTITDATIADNTATNAPGGGIRALGTLTVSGSTISGNQGKCCAGGLHGGRWDVPTTITLTNSTISGNTATWHNTGTPQYFPGVGGGMSVEYATTTLNHVTVAGNVAQTNPHTGTPGQAGGVRIHNGSFTANNSIVHGNSGSQDCLADGGAVVGGTTNLVGVDECGLPGSDGLDPLLGGLVDNGGPTDTHALPATGSPALDAANDSVCQAVDQRGVSRPFGEHCDIGAYEHTTEPVPEDYTVTSCTDPGLATLTTVTGDLIVDVTEACALTLPALELVGGDITLSGGATATALDLPELTSLGGELNLGCAATLTSIAVPQLTTVGGEMTVTETSLTTFEAPALSTLGGGMTMSGNPSLTTIQVPLATSTGGGMTMTGNPSLTTLEADSLAEVPEDLVLSGNVALAGVTLTDLTTVGGDLDLSGNGATATTSMPALESVGGSMTMTDEATFTTTGCTEPATSAEASGGMLATSLPSLSTVGGDVVLETQQADLDVSGMQVSGDITLSGTGDVAAQTAAGATGVGLRSTGASMSVLLPGGTFTSHVGFEISTLTGSALDAQEGTAADGSPATVDAVSAYQFLFDVPSLGQPATLAFELDLAALTTGQRTLVLSALADGQLTVAVRDDASASTYQAFAVCGAGQTPSADDCVTLSLLDADRQPVAEGADPTYVRLEGVAGHFSTWAVAVVSPLAPLDVSISGPVTRAEGRALALSAGITGAAGNPTVEWTAAPVGAVDTGATCEFSAPTAPATSLTCTDDGVWDVTAQVTDGSRNASDTHRVTVTNAPPMVAITSPADYAQRAVSKPVAVTATIDDRGANDTHSCTINWGDGTTTNGVVSNDTCTGEHTFPSVGVRLVTVKVTDDDGAVDTAQVNVVSVNARSLVTGGGAAGPVGERTSFGLVVLEKDAKPSGQVVVQAASGKRFKASVVKNLVVEDPEATWQGTGRWGKKTGCPYQITVVDGRLISDTAPDRISLTVWGPGGAVLFQIDRVPLKAGKLTIFLNRL